MGLFTKRESTRIERDEEGRATLTRAKEPHGRAAVKEMFRRPVDRRELTHEEQFPKRIQPAFVRQRRKERLVKTIKATDKWVGRNLQPIGGYPSRPGRSRRRANTMDFGMQPIRKPRRQTNYAVVGGKAYPIAGKKKKKKKSTKKRAGHSFDIMDNWGFMK